MSDYSKTIIVDFIRRWQMGFTNLPKKDKIYGISTDKDNSRSLTLVEIESSGSSGGSFTETDPVYTADKPNIALKSEIPDISTKADKSDIPDISGLATKEEIPDVSNLVTKEELDTKGYITNIPDEYITETELNAKGYLTQHQDISGKQDTITDLDVIRDGANKGATALQSYIETDPVYTADKPSLALKTELETKQDILVSGTNIKTINGIDLLGKGDITIQSDISESSKVEIENDLKSYVDKRLGEVETLLSEI